MMTRTVTGDPKNLAAVLDKLPQDQPVVMLNILKYREHASYEDGIKGTDREAYARYGGLVYPILQRIGANVIYAAKAAGMLIAPDNEQWDDVLLVQYPSVAAFKQMITGAEYLAITHHRTAALLDSRLIATLA